MKILRHLTAGWWGRSPDVADEPDAARDLIALPERIAKRPTAQQLRDIEEKLSGGSTGLLASIRKHKAMINTCSVITAIEVAAPSFQLDAFVNHDRGPVRSIDKAAALNADLEPGDKRGEGR